MALSGADVQLIQVSKRVTVNESNDNTRRANSATALLLAALVAGFLAAVTAAAVAAEPPNPGFEESADGLLASWTLEGKLNIPANNGATNAKGVRAIWDNQSHGSGAALPPHGDRRPAGQRRGPRRLVAAPAVARFRLRDLVLLQSHGTHAGKRRSLEICRADRRYLLQRQASPYRRRADYDQLELGRLGEAI